jgi:hypothetical protein
MAPTKTAMLCVSGRVGRNCDRRTVGTSPESVSLIVLVGKWSVTGFWRCGAGFGGQHGEGRHDKRKSNGRGDAHLDDLEQLLRAVHAANTQLVQQLDWRVESGKSAPEPARPFFVQSGRDAPIRPEKRLNVLGIRT